MQTNFHLKTQKQFSLSKPLKGLWCGSENLCKLELEDNTTPSALNRDCENMFAYSLSTSDLSPFSSLAAVSALAKFGAQNENLLPSILVLLQR